MELSCDVTLNDQFNPNHPRKFRLEVSTVISCLVIKSYEKFLLFETSYMCETQLIVENEIEWFYLHINHNLTNGEKKEALY